MFTENILTAIQKTNSIINNKESFTINCVVASVDPVYFIPNPIKLNQERKHRAALINFSSDNYFENLNSKGLKNNKFYYSINKGADWIALKIDNGFFDVEEYGKEIVRQMMEKGHYDKSNPDRTKHEPFIKFEVYLSIYKTVINITNENYMIDFTRDDTFRKSLGFGKVKLGKGRNVGENRIQITEVKRLNFHCDLITGGYDNNGKKSDIILSFPLGGVEITPGNVISLSPNTPVFLPVEKSEIDVIRFGVTDQFGNKLESEGEELSWCILVEQV